MASAKSFWRKRKGCSVCAHTDPVRHVKPSAHHDDWLGCCRKTPGGLAVRCYKRPFLTRGHPFGVSDSEMSLGDMPRDATHQGTKCRRSGINLIIVGTVRERTQLLDEGAIPRSFYKPHHSLFALRGEWVSASFFASMFRFDRY